MGSAIDILNHPTGIDKPHKSFFVVHLCLFLVTFISLFTCSWRPIYYGGHHLFHGCLKILSFVYNRRRRNGPVWSYITVIVSYMTPL